VNAIITHHQVYATAVGLIEISASLPHDVSNVTLEQELSAYSTP
jgi:hypothetical protein